MSRSESVVYGIHAALALAKHRPKAIHRVHFLPENKKVLGPLFKATAAQKRPYRQGEANDLDKISGTVHHEGVVVVADPLPTYPVGPRRTFLNESKRIIALDGVTNPHNVGAIIRSMAWFGCDALLVNNGHPSVNPAAVRISQGGAETVPCIRTPKLMETIGWLREHNFTVLAADQNGKKLTQDLRQIERLCLVLGSETRGLSQAVARACTQRISIPGTGAVESLNVSVAASVLMALSQP